MDKKLLEELGINPEDVGEETLADGKGSDGDE